MAQSREIVVTGGASGIGAATVDKFLSLGDRVTVLDLNPNPRATTNITCNLTDPESIDAAVAALPERIDVLANVAGVAGTAPLATVMTVNFLAIRHLTELIIPNINQGGSVVTVASTSGWYWRDHLPDVLDLVRTPDTASGVQLAAATISDGYLAYNRSKEAVIVWTSYAAQRHLGRVRLNTVSPGPIETPLLAAFYESMGEAELEPLRVKAGRHGKPGEIADVIAYLAGDQATWINGTDVQVDGGAEAAVALDAADQQNSATA